MRRIREQILAPKVFILILNWNGWRDTIACLESVYRASYPDYQVVVLDNGSHDDSVNRILAWAAGTEEKTATGKLGISVRKPLPVISYDRQEAERGGRPEEQAAGGAASPLVLVRTGANLGFAGGNNVGIRYAMARGADYILLLNNDAFFRASDSLSLMTGFMERTPRAGACGGRLFYPDGLPQQSFGNFPALWRVLANLLPLYKLVPSRWLKGLKRANVVPDDTIRTPLGIDWPSGACLMVRGETVRDVGMMDEEYFLYVEETDWCFRMREKGWDRYYLPEVEVTHVFGGSVRKASTSMRRFHLESQFLYYQKHFPRPAQAAAAAGFFLRSLVTIPCWQTAAWFCFGNACSAARENREYWRHAFRLSATALHRFVSKKYEEAPSSADAPAVRHV